jgi:AcrR family transcriptional regulator
MPDALRDHAREAVRAEVVRPAWSLFAEQGYESTTVDQVADASGMSRRTFFRNFTGKDELVLHTMVGSGTQVADALQARPTAVAASPVRVWR